jgi:hypothetical protein
MSKHAMSGDEGMKQDAMPEDSMKQDAMSKCAIKKVDSTKKEDGANGRDVVFPQARPNRAGL